MMSNFTLTMTSGQADASARAAVLCLGALGLCSYDGDVVPIATEDLFAGIVPIAISIEVDPGIQQTSRGRSHRQFTAKPTN